MRVVLLQNTIFKRVLKKAGEVIDVPPKVAKEMQKNYLAHIEEDISEKLQEKVETKLDKIEKKISGRKGHK